MQKNKKLVYTILLFLILSVLTIDVSSKNNDIPCWNNDWSYREEITIPIKTNEESAEYQPIDIYFEFKNKCWGKNETAHSIRTCCWSNNKWYELENQIYNIEHEDSESYIEKCGIIFLIPEFADGNERYFIYYVKK